MNRVLVCWNFVITVILILLLTSRFSSHAKVQVANTAEVVRTNRVEIVDQNGKIKATLGMDGTDSSNPKLVLYNSAGHEAAFLTVNSKGYGAIYFQDKKTEGKVAVGYLWGSDSATPSEVEDPLSSWGIRVRGLNGTQTSFGVLSSGQNISQSKPVNGPR